MPQNFDLPPTETTSGLMVLSPAPAGLPGEWHGAAPPPPAILSAGLDPMWLLHSLRRRWVLALSLGLTAGLVSALLVWLLVPSTGSATAYFKVASVKPHILRPIDEGSDANFQTYRQTLSAQFKTPFVLLAALRKNNIDKLDCLRDEEDQVNWLRTNLVVKYPDNAEILTVTLKGERPEDLEKVVDAVAQAFKEKVIDEDIAAANATKETLERSYDGIKKQIEVRTDAYNKLAATLKTRESTDAGVDQKLALTELSVMRDEREKLRTSMFSDAVKATLLKAQRAGAMPASLQADDAVSQDPQINLLRQQLNELDLQIAEERTVARRADSPSLARLAERKRSHTQQLAQRMAAITGQAAGNGGSEADAYYRLALKESQLRHAMYNQRLEEIEKSSEEVVERVKKANERSLDLDRIKTELDHLVRVADMMGEKVQAWEVESNSPGRVKPLGTEATPGLNRIQRSVVTSFGGALGLAVCCFGIAAWDFRHRKLNHAQQVDEGLGLRVMGELPPLARQGKSPMGPRLSLLLEAVDSVRTLLIHTNHGQNPRVVLVTSAASREGRSTVAGQLAASLARSGRRTVLVDGDLRHPSLHQVFNVPFEAGLCEVLRGQTTAKEAVRATDAPNLWIVTAGRCDVTALQALAQDAAGPALAELRTQFDYVVIDAAPALSLADSLLLGQHVDGAIISTLRDVSRVPQIHAVSERLKSVGIRVLGVVVNGVPRSPHERTAALLPAAAEG